MTHSGCHPATGSGKRAPDLFGVAIAVFDVLRQLVEGLITELSCAESDTRVALRLRRMQLPQSDDGLAVALLIERDGGAECSGF
jgi:hypothetical protein